MLFLTNFLSVADRALLILAWRQADRVLSDQRQG